MDSVILVLADVLVLPVVLTAAAAVLLLPKAKRWQAVTRGTVAALTALFFAKVVAQFYQGTRPFVEMGVDPKASFLPNPGFPSDHALLVFTAALIVLASTRNIRLSILLLVCSALVALGRVLALVHTPLDVIGGFACALLAAVLWYGPELEQKYYTKI